MNQPRRTHIILGLILILAGAWMLAQQYYPEMRLWETLAFSWPWYVIGAGGLLLLLALLISAPGMAVPACIVAGIGAILYYQNETGNWGSWAYLWTLIPGFVGLGVLLMGLLGGTLRSRLHHGLSLLLASLVLFAVFGALLGGLGRLGDYWPVLLILFGLWFIFQPMLERSSQR